MASNFLLKITPKFLKVCYFPSRYTGDDERSVHAVLRNRVKPAKHPKRKVLTSIGTTHTEARNQNSTGIREFSARNDVLGLNYHESAALINAHVRRCKLRTEAESAHAETVAQGTSYAEMRRIRARRVDDVFMQFGSKLDQAKQSPSYNLKMVVKVTRDDQQSHYTRFGVTLNWQRTDKRERKRLQPYGSSTLLWTSSMEVAEFFDQFVPT